MMMAHYFIVYTSNGEISAIVMVNDDGSTISFPNDPANSNYAAYDAWLSEGNTPNPYIPPPEPAPLTPQEKLEAAGLTVTELKSLLGLK